MTVIKTARIGMVNFINTAPLYETWKSTVNREDFLVFEANPAELNRKMAEGLLDLGFMSSHEYAVDPLKYRILPNLSISASGPVGSVFLFADTEPENLGGGNVYLSRQSQTSNSLVKIILEDFLGVAPRYIFPESEDFALGGSDAVLAIGDRALRMKTGGSYKVVLDLGELWQRFTGLPFVFAIWAVRDEFAEKCVDLVAEIHRELLRCVREGSGNLEAISALVAPRIPMPVRNCHDYLKAIEYDLDLKKREALELYCSYLAERGEGQKDALPLRLINMD